MSTELHPVDEMLPVGQLFLYGLQHVMSMYAGVVAVPLMVLIMLLAARRRNMGRFPIPAVLKLLGWAATGVMGAAAVVMFATAFLPHH